MLFRSNTSCNFYLVTQRIAKLLCKQNLGQFSNKEEKKKKSKMSEATESCRFIYKDPNRPIEARVNDLLSHMSLKEKVGLMTCTENPAASPSTIKDLSIGTLFLIICIFCL